MWLTRILSAAGPNGRLVQGVGLRLLTCHDYDFAYRRVCGCLSVVSVACCQVEVSATGRSLVQRSLIESDVSECDCGISTKGSQGPLGLSSHEKKKISRTVCIGLK
jgi:hypothetical protein